MREAHRVLEALHPRGSYTGSFWPGGHVFTAGMQDEAITFLASALKPATNTDFPPIEQPARTP
jgi:hypothetical protein